MDPSFAPLNGNDEIRVGDELPTAEAEPEAEALTKPENETDLTKPCQDNETGPTNQCQDNQTDATKPYQDNETDPTKPCQDNETEDTSQDNLQNDDVAQSDSQEDQIAPPSSPVQIPLKVSESSSSDECILIPKHAVVDDVSIKFILHPNLAPCKSSGSSLHSCTHENERKSGAGKEMSSSPDSNERIYIPPTRKKKLTRTNRTPTSNPSTGEHHVIKSAKEILYDIAQGKWNRKGMIIDEEMEGTKKFSSKSKPCSNAYCVRAAEKEQRRQRDSLLFQDFEVDQPIFEEGHLPSYHSLLGFWKFQEEQKERHTWVQKVFKNGYPENESEFLKVWRECRKNPQAYGIKVSEPEELPMPDITQREQGSRVRKVVKPYHKCLLAGQAVDKRPPVRLASKEYYNSDWKPVNSLREREKQRCRYEELRRLYPHLPLLRGTDYKMNPATVKQRIKQAEEWHELVTVSNMPVPMVQLSHYAADMKDGNNKADLADSPPESASSSELDFGTSREMPRYANNTTSSMNKIKQYRFK